MSSSNDLIFVQSSLFHLSTTFGSRRRCERPCASSHSATAAAADLMHKEASDQAKGRGRERDAAVTQPLESSGSSEQQAAPFLARQSPSFSNRVRKEGEYLVKYLVSGNTLSLLFPRLPCHTLRDKRASEGAGQSDDGRDSMESREKLRHTRTR